MPKGALHVHSTYSDGEFTLAELRDIFLGEACTFVCMTDHAEYFDSQKLAAYIAECQALSDPKLQFVVGLEYRCERDMHILGYGATKNLDSPEPETVIRHIESIGAISVIAHPKNDFFGWIEGFQTLPSGIETWNSKYDGRYGPRPGTFALQQNLRRRSPNLHAFYGLDLHWKKQFRGLLVNVDSDGNQPSQILQALRAGAFSGSKGDLSLPSSGVLPAELLSQFAAAHDRSYRMWQALKQSKKTLDRFGIRVPEALKAHLRRIF